MNRETITIGRNNNMLKDTYYCNYNHNKINELAKNLTTTNESPAGITQNIYMYVRDSIIFGFDSVQVKASETLEKGYGACWNKALLMVALLRWNKIQSRVAWFPLRKNFSRPTFGRSYIFSNNPFNHGFVEAYLDEKWIKIDPTLDRNTYEKCFLPLNPGWGNDWNGKNNNIIYQDSIMGPSAYTTDIDNTFESDFGNSMPPRLIIPFISKLLNRKLWKTVGNTMVN